MKKILLGAESVRGTLKAVDGIAYSGGAVNQPWSEIPIVIDLNGMEVAPQIPLMCNHDNEPSHRLGIVEAEIAGGKLRVHGGLDLALPQANEIAEAGKRIPWQLSVGAEIRSAERIDEDETVNGRLVKAPAIVARETLLREVSVVAIGADAETELNIAACWNIEKPNHINQAKNGELTMAKNLKFEGEIMPEDEKPVTDVTAEETAPVTEEVVEEEEKDETKTEGEAEPATPNEQEEEKVAEIKQRAKMADIVAILDGAPNGVIAKAVKQGWTVDMAKAVADSVKSVKAGRPSTANVIVKNGNSTTKGALEAALSFRAGMDGDAIAKAYGEQTAEVGYTMRGLSLKDTLRECLKLSGRFSGDFLGHEDIQAGFQTTDLPKLLGNVANKALLKSFEAREIAATKLCSAGDIADYKEATRVRISDLKTLDEIPEGGEVTETAIGEDYALNQVKRYAQVFWLDEKLIVNDDLGAFLKLPAILGARAADFVDQTFFAKLTANANFTDGKALFSTDHKNLKTGTTTALSLDAIKAAYSAMRKQTDKGGMPINVFPKYLVVPAELEADALELVSTQIVVGGSTRSAGENIISKWGLQVVASPYLDSNSTKAWYLFADPTVCDTFEIGYLRGQRSPIVEQGQYDLSRFGVGYRVRFDFGVSPLDFRGVYKAKGEA